MLDNELLELFLNANNSTIEHHELRQNVGLPQKTVNLGNQQSLETSRLNIQGERARSEGWIIYPNGEAYERQLSHNSIVYLFLEDDGTYTAWRGTWREGSSPTSEKVIAKNVNFNSAFLRANEYIKWFLKSQTKRFKKR